jgi:hypothetical protein
MTDPMPSAAAILAGAPVPQPADDPTGNLYDAARHALAIAHEPDGLSRLRGLLVGIYERAAEEGREEIREKVREVAHQRAVLSDARAQRARELLPHDVNQAAAETRWAANLLDQVNALRSVLLD